MVQAVMLLRHLAVFSFIALGIHLITSALEMGAPNANRKYGQIIVHAENPAGSVQPIIQQKILAKEALRIGLHTADKVVQNRIQKNLDFLGIDSDNHDNQPALIENMLKNDLVVTRRLADSMRRVIVAEQIATPTQEQLYNYYLDNQNRYLGEKTYLLNLSEVSDNKIIVQLNRQFNDTPMTLNNIAKLLPKDLVENIAKSKRGDRLEYCKNSVCYRLELVTVFKPKIKDFREVRALVQKDYTEAQQKKLIADYIHLIKQHYEILVVEGEDKA